MSVEIVAVFRITLSISKGSNTSSDNIKEVRQSLFGENNVYTFNFYSNGPAQTTRVSPATTTAEIKDLTTGRTYEAWVTASTRAGEGAATRRVSHTPSQRGK